ncbi:MAG: DNA adenine methylase, partial [Sneathiella sp.]
MEKEFFKRPVAAGQGAAPYLGGKRVLSSEIVPMIDAIPHLTYAEAFVGMGGIFFRRNYASKQEVINDFGGEVATFFRVLQRHYVAFLEMMKFQITTRSEFERLRGVDPSTLTDMERAARFYYLQTLSFGGSPRHNSFGVQVGVPGR